MSCDSDSFHIDHGDGLVELIDKDRALQLKEQLEMESIPHIEDADLNPIAIWMTDPHLSPSTIDVNLSIYRQVFDLAQSENIKVIYLGGDVFESRKAQPQEVLNVFANILKEANERGLIIRAIPGNHDKTSYIEESSFLDVYEPYSRFELIRSVEYYDYRYIRVHLIPYFDEKLVYLKYLDQAISNIDDDKNNILLTHIGIDGVLNNNKDSVDVEVDRKAFNKFDYVYIGHFHDQQQIVPNIIYTGSCYQANFGEDSAKGCCLINPNGTIQHIQLDFPRYTTIQIKKELTLEDINNIIDEKTVDCNYKVQLVGCDDNVSSEYVAMLRSAGIKVENKQEKEIVDGDQSLMGTSFQLNDIKESFEEWCKKRNPSNIEYGREKINNIS